MKQLLPLLALILLPMAFSCTQEKEHTAPAIHARDSVSMMTSYGVNTLISDSGVMKYRIVTEKWEVNTVRNPSRWIFERGLFLEQFDEKFHVQAYIQSDTAYFYDQLKLWSCVAGCVCAQSTVCASRVRNSTGTRCAMSSTATSTRIS